MLQSQMGCKIITAQEKAIKLRDPTLSLDELFTKHKILRFKDLVKLEQCKLGYKLCHDLLPNALSNNMKRDHRNESIIKTHKYLTRNKTTPNLLNVSGRKYRSSFLFNAIKLYSALNNEIQSSVNLSVFTSRCKKYYLQ